MIASVHMVIDALEYLQMSLDMGKLFLIITHIHNYGV